MRVEELLKICNTDIHSYSKVEEHTGATEYVCKKCGKKLLCGMLPIDKCFENEHDFVVIEQSEAFRLYKCINCSKEKMEYVCEKIDIKHDTVNFVDDSDYVILNPGVTCMLYDNILKLTIENKNMQLRIEKDIVHVGTAQDADVLFANNAISPKHATFYFEHQAWYLQDNNSDNGTWLNDIRLISGKKYLLTTDDRIRFSETEKIIFNKSASRTWANQDEAVIIDSYINKVVADKYRIIEYLGAGGFNKIYLVEEMQTNSKWAMKICDKKQKNFNAYVKGAILKEPYTLKKFNHPMIPTVKDIFEDENAIYVVREFANGHTLKQVVDEGGPLPEEKVIEWAKELCNMFVYLHNQNPPYIYRDMKPANVILMENGDLKVIDFGTTRVYDRRKHGDTCILGTMGYAAPEQYGGLGQTDARTDIFGLGKTLHHLVTGVDPILPPYEVKPIREIDPTLSKGFEYIIDKCIRLRPDERYQSCEELLHDLYNYKNLPKKKSFWDRLFGNK